MNCYVVDPFVVIKFAFERKTGKERKSQGIYSQNVKETVEC